MVAKPCTKCGIEKEVSEYYPRYHRGGVPMSQCKKCTNSFRKKYRTPVTKAREKARRVEIKTLALEAYGGTRCACCGETNQQFLTLDHVFNDGFTQQPNVKKRLYWVLRKQGYPDKERLQVLCFNCNCGKKVNGGTCPHMTTKEATCPGAHYQTI